ncbi:helix-turn-helix domain-containing protein [Levilactobacillus angrenensis]|uniref:Helix-turn-helix domain-containing protein n=1 Tax=Levilactobacillus angrenensis TaxID=2486020 RepID=A0ABW1UBI4_9LACO|nr:AraC family transcriptional regulator [Levilactobacillus angrenensis]
MNKVYKFLLEKPVRFYKAGQYFAEAGWRHKNIINDGDYELFIMLKGIAYIQIGHTQYTLRTHDCLLIPPHIRHIGFQGSPADTVYYWMHFFPSSSVTTSYVTDEIHHPTSPYAVNLPQQFTVKNFGRLILLIRQMLDSDNDETMTPLASDLFISSVLVELSHQFMTVINQDQEYTSRFELIKNWIRIHSHEKLTVDIVATEFKITPVYLTKLFRTYEGMTTIHFINLTKIKQAQELLLTTDLSVKEIAYELGFTNEKYFLRLFKRLSSLTPTKYRDAYAKTYLNNIEVDPTIPLPENR